MVVEKQRATDKTQSWVSAFQRVQLMLGWWGIILIVGGYLHNSNASARGWGIATMLWVWVGLTIVGLVGSYLLAPAMLVSGMLFLWSLVIVVAFVATWLIMYPLNRAGVDFILPIWCSVFSIAYLLNARYMDKRLYWLAAWHGIIALMLLLWALKIFNVEVISNNRGLVFGLITGIPLLIAALPFWKERF